jgi:hypothetical protein
VFIGEERHGETGRMHWGTLFLVLLMRKRTDMDMDRLRCSTKMKNLGREALQPSNSYGQDRLQNLVIYVSQCTAIHLK